MADFVGGKTRSERAGADFVGGISICNILFQNIKIRRVRGSAFCQKKNNPFLFWQSFS